MIFLVADPDTEVRVCPRTGRQPVQGLHRHTPARFGKGHRFKSRIVADSLVNQTKKIAAAVGVVIPGVLAVQNDGNMLAVADFLDTPDQVGCAVAWRAM